MSSNFFTIVIPTKDRADTLRFTLLSALSVSYPHFKVLVSDNASTDTTQSLVESFQDPRLQYVNPGRRLSMSSHWEFALSHVSEGLVTILGDDDGILPDALSSVDSICKRTGVSAVRSVVGLYHWPGFNYPDSPARLTTLVSRGEHLVQSPTALQSVLNGYSGYGILPMLYTGGFVDISIVNQMRKPNASLFASVNPDVYSAIAISHLVDNYVLTDECLAIAGHSKHSNGAAFLKSQDDKDSSALRDMFDAENDIPIHPALNRTSVKDLPRSMQLLVCESYLQAFHLHHLRPGINFSLQSQLTFILNQTLADPLKTKKLVSDVSSIHGFVVKKDLSIKEKFLCFIAALKRLFSKLYFSLYKCYFAGSAEQPIANIYEAVVISTHFKMHRPSSIYCMLLSLKKILNLRKR